jgi:hypothetical protein
MVFYYIATMYPVPVYMYVIEDDLIVPGESFEKPIRDGKLLNYDDSLIYVGGKTSSSASSGPLLDDIDRNSTEHGPECKHK